MKGEKKSQIDNIYIYIYCIAHQPTCGMTGSGLYTWNDYEQRRGNVGRGKGSLVRANGVTILGKSEICT